MKHVDIALGEKSFKASFFTFGQAIDIAEAISDLASSDIPRQIKGNCAIIAAGLSEHHPEITADAVMGWRGTIPQLVAATRAILKFNEYEVGPGKTPAPATA